MSELFPLFNIDRSKPQKSLIKTPVMPLSNSPCSFVALIIPGNTYSQIAQMSCDPKICTAFFLVELTCSFTINPFISRGVLQTTAHPHRTGTYLAPLSESCIEFHIHLRANWRLCIYPLLHQYHIYDRPPVESRAVGSNHLDGFAQGWKRILF